MAKPTYASVTEEPCSCGALERLSQQSGSAVVFDSRLNEFHIVSSTPGGTKVTTLVYHCIFCGGVMPPSKREEFFRPVEEAERLRLTRILDRITSLNDAIAVLGKPDLDDSIAPATFDMESESPSSLPLRVFTYTTLSETADVQIALLPSGRVQVSILPKTT
jgi:hypothetical protein